MTQSRDLAAVTELDPVHAAALLGELLPVARAELMGPAPVCRVDPSLALQNVARGLVALDAVRQDLQRALPELQWHRVDRARNTALALVYAAGLVDRHQGSTGRIAELRTEAAELRDLLMAAAKLLTRLGKVDKAAVATIQKGGGPIDNAHDCVALAEVVGPHATSIGVAPQAVESARQTGTELLSLLKSGNARRTDSTGQDAAWDRDALWALLLGDHREMRRAGMYLWVDSVDDFVPRLGARKP